MSGPYHPLRAGRSGAFQGPYSFQSRFESGAGTNPEELIAAAHAGCFSMALSHALAQAGHPPTRVHTTAKVHLQPAAGGFSIPRIDLVTEAVVPGVSEAAFRDQAEQAKKTCPVSKGSWPGPKSPWTPSWPGAEPGGAGRPDSVAGGARRSACTGWRPPRAPRGGAGRAAAGPSSPARPGRPRPRPAVYSWG